MDHREQKIGDLIKTFSQSEKVQEKLFQKRLELRWEELFGHTVNEHTARIRLSQGRLTIYLNSSSMHHEMHLAKENIKAIVNGELRENYVREIILRNG